ncbi:MAG: A/G-specific adenine glycosylase [Puniceicoccales bacterium]|nr:A/G-specific adenine glycosylase [Puniceicoccales bacterium]
MPLASLSRASILFLQRSIVDFFAHNARILPWRQQRSVYHTLVSEIMLQQTQVKTVIPYFERWIQRFPSLEALAQADATEVLHLWEGLGYYNRAHSLRHIAKTISQQAHIPSTPDEWKTLPGIGHYTAAAIASLAQNTPIAVVDGNVVRVLARFWNIHRLFDHKGQALTYLCPIADQCLDRAHHALYNEGMMELGATLCLPQNPHCPSCPLRSHCQAHAHGTAQKIPRFQMTVYRKVCRARGIYLRGHELWLSPMNQHSKAAPLIWEFPEISLSDHNTSIASPIFTGRRSIGHTHFTERFYVIEFLKNTVTPHTGQWHSLTELNRLTLSGPHRKWFPKLQKVFSRDL